MADKDYARNRNIVLLVFFIFYLYLSHNRNKLQQKKNWRSVTCNPLDMVISGIFNSDNSNSSFEKCMQYSVSDDVERRVEEHSEKLDKHLENSINKLTSSSSKDKNATDILIGNTASEINKLKTDGVDNKVVINDFKIKFAQLTEQVNNAFTQFKDPSNNLLTKLEL
jgi:hypothetical protein